MDFFFPARYKSLQGNHHNCGGVGRAKVLASSLDCWHPAYTAAATFFYRGNNHVPHWESNCEPQSPGASTPKGWRAPFSLLHGSSEFSGVTKATSSTSETAWLQTHAVKPSPFETCKVPPLHLPPQGPYYLLSVCISIHGINNSNKVLSQRTSYLVLPFDPTPESFQKRTCVAFEG